MKPKFKCIIRFDYLSTLLFIVSFVATLLLLAIILVAAWSSLAIILPLELAVVGLLVFRIKVVGDAILKVKDNKTKSTEVSTMRNNGNFYVSFSYEYNGEQYRKRVILLAGPLMRSKINKLTELNLMVDNENPKKVYIEDLFYKQN